MKYFDKIFLLLIVLIGASVIAVDDGGTVKITTRYTDAITGQLSVTDSPVINIPSISSLKIDEIYVSDPGMKKTMCVLGLKTAMEDSVVAYHAHSNPEEQQKIGAILFGKIEPLQEQFKALNIDDLVLEEAFGLAHKLAGRMQPSNAIAGLAHSISELIGQNAVIDSELRAESEKLLSDALAEFDKQYKALNYTDRVLEKVFEVARHCIESIHDEKITPPDINSIYNDLSNDATASTKTQTNRGERLHLTAGGAQDFNRFRNAMKGMPGPQGAMGMRGMAGASGCTGFTGFSQSELGITGITGLTGPYVIEKVTGPTGIDKSTVEANEVATGDTGAIEKVTGPADAAKPTKGVDEVVTSDKGPEPYKKPIVIDGRWKAVLDDLEHVIADQGKNGIPTLEQFEGFLHEFYLPLHNQGTCSKLMCVTPAIAVDPYHKKLFVQVGMDSGFKADEFKRKPLNLALVIDVSGSMEDSDGTEKSRLEWAKEAALLTLNELGADDMVSLVVFNYDATVIIEPSFYAQGNKQELQDKIKQLGACCGTNLEAGLRKGYELVARNIKPDYENRVILISDAGLNTGKIDDASLLGLVSDYAMEKIGLTAIGVGQNFNQAFINKIATTNGGNYVFAQSGKQFERLFKNFKFLVSPVAYNVAADIDIRGIDATLAKAYGIPFKEGDELKELVNIRTLFFCTSEGGGGAMILEYDLA